MFGCEYCAWVIVGFVLFTGDIIGFRVVGFVGVFLWCLRIGLCLSFWVS